MLPWGNLYRDVYNFCSRSPASRQALHGMAEEVGRLALSGVTDPAGADQARLNSRTLQTQGGDWVISCGDDPAEMVLMSAGRLRLHRQTVNLPLQGKLLLPEHANRAHTATGQAAPA